MQTAIDLYAQIITAALPFAIVFSIGNLIVSTFLKMAFGGKVTF